ncbi:MAG: hypothetical protein GXY19_04290 [Phycisphaerae bacterium]|nr:hypothetical protein [Phycisphaerae bacterium]
MYRTVLWLAVISAFLTSGVAGADQFIVKINFQLDTAVVPEGYLMDCGEVYGDRGNGYSYGWSAAATSDDRERNTHSDQRYDTFVHFSKGSDKTWEIQVPEGDYDLFLVCGEQDNTSQVNTLDVEGVIFTDPDGPGNFDEYSGRVTVTDGRLTIKPAAGANNAKICFIDIIQCPPPDQARNPVPENGAADVVLDVVLAWTAAASAGKHNVYLGAGADDVNNATATSDLGTLVSEGQTEATYESPSVLTYGQTYYWRVDEVNAADGTVSKGELWTFTVETYAYPLKAITATAVDSQTSMGPANTIDRSGLNEADQHSTEPTDMWLSNGTQPNWILYEFDQVYMLHELWVWNSNTMLETFSGYGAKDVAIEYSQDGVAWTQLADVPEFSKATGAATYVHNTTVNFGGVPAKYVKLTINATWGGGALASLSEVRFFYVPVAAFSPDPPNGVSGVAIDATLNWHAGRQAASHTVYLSADADAVAAGTAQAETITEHSFTPSDLEFATTYYWRVDEVNETMDSGVYEGSVWSFTVEDYKVIDDFESFNDSDNCIFDTWCDGYIDKSSGSQVGYIDSIDGTFGERTIVHEDAQSMPVIYSNLSSPYYSEVTRTFAGAQDWTANGVKSLCLFFRGTSGNTGEMYLKINNTKVAYYGEATDIAAGAWVPWIVDLSTVSGTLNKVTKLTIGVEGSGSTGILYIDDIRLYGKPAEFITPTEPDAASLLASYQFEGNANDSSGHGLNGAITDGQLVSPGKRGEGKAVQLNDAGHVDLGRAPSLDFGTVDWAVTAWYKNTNTGTGTDNKGTIFAKGGDNTGGHRYCLIMSETTEGVLSLVTDNNVTKYVVDSVSVTNDDEWHCVVGQRKGTALEIYIDGHLEGAGSVAATYNLAGTSQHNAYVGAITNHADSSLYKLYIGLIDDVRVYNRALSDAEILWLAGRMEPLAKPF